MSRDAVSWAEEQLGSRVVEVRRLEGGMTSTMWALAHEDGSASVLRLIDVEPWRTHGAALATRERQVQLDLADSAVPAPRSLALDITGRVEGVAAHLMSLLPGAADERRVDDGSLGALAATLARIHEVRPKIEVREYQSWAFEAKYVVPAWAEDPGLWRDAFDLLCNPPPTYEPTFLHRDFQPRNVLWDDVGLTGIVDWVEASMGPAWLDVAHCCTNIALRDGNERAGAFATAYTRATGRTASHYWDVMDTVGFLPVTSDREMIKDPVEQRRMELWLGAVLGR